MEILKEKTLTIHQACQVLPKRRRGARPHFATVWRYIMHGAKALDGTLVRLEAERFGGAWITSEEAISRFMARLSEMPNNSPLSLPAPAARRRAADEADKKNRERGL